MTPERQVLKERMAVHTSDDKDLFDMQSAGMQEGSRNSANEDTKVVIAAHRLAVDFTEEANLPVRFRKLPSSAKSRKIKEDSEVEKRFRANVMSWTRLIKTLLAKISNRLAWRFINLSPEVHPTVRTVTDCKDFCDFVDYLILRRDTEKCGADELGGLALLLTAFQREIEKRIQPLQVAKMPEPAGADNQRAVVDIRKSTSDHR
jgi:hypothetical protein